MKFLRHLEKRNMLNTNYKVWCITLNLPIIGNKLNNILQNHYYNKYNHGSCSYIDTCNTVDVVRKWYLKRKEG